MQNQVKERLKSFGYVFRSGDEAILSFSIQKVEQTIKNDCCLTVIPEGLNKIAIDMAAGEFLKTKKTFAPDDLSGIDLGIAVKQIQEGDTNIVFSAGEANLTQEQRLDQLLAYLLTHGREEFSCYRRLRW